LKVKIIGDNNYLGDVKEEFFKNRGVSNPKDIINVSSKSLTDPYLFKNMRESVDLFSRHNSNNSNILFIVDSDVDGITSTSILVNYISKNFKDNNLDYVVHKKKIHGIFMHEFSDEILQWTDLLIIADAASNNYSEHKILKEEHNIDIIILDHHECPKYSKDAIVVNNQLDKVSPDLSGAGMAYKFIKALDIKYGFSDADNYLDLVSIGLIGDMMDTSDLEVQYMIQTGIENINNEMLNQIIDSTSYVRKGIINQKTVGWNIAPLLNAVTRVGTHEDNLFLFESFINKNLDSVFPYEVTRGKSKGEILQENIYEACYRMMARVKGKQDRIVKNAVEGNTRIRGLIKDIKDNANIVFVNATNRVEEDGLSGLLANKIGDIYNKPTLVYTYRGNDIYSGSGRSRKIFNFKDALSNSNIVDFAEGHQGAFGTRFHLQPENDIKVMEYKIKNYFKTIEIDSDIDVDFSIEAKFLDEYLIEDLCSLQYYFGRGMEEPKIHLYNVEINTSDIFTGKDHKSFWFYVNDVKIITFDKSGELYSSLVGWDDAYVYELIGKPSINEFKGERYVQIEVTDIELVNSTGDKDLEDDGFSWDIEEDWEGLNNAKSKDEEEDEFQW